MFIHLFFNVLSVFLMMLPGFLVVKYNVIKESALKDFSQVIVTVFYPLLIFSFIISNFSFQTIIDSWQLPVSLFTITIIGLLVGLLYQRFFRSNNERHDKSILFQFTFNNYSFMPLAIIANIYDEKYMAALLFATLGAEFAIWTIGMLILNKQDKGFRLSNLRHLLAPPMIGIYSALAVLLLLHIFDTSIAEITQKVVFGKYMQNVLFKLGQATIPLSMLMVGGRMGKIKIENLKSIDVWVVTFFRLIAIPAVAIFVLLNIFGNHQFINVMLIVAVMPNAAASLVLGELYNADQTVMSGTVLITTVISLLTIPLWLHFLAV